MNAETARALAGTIAIVAVNVLATLGVSLDLNLATSIALIVLIVAATAWGCYKNHNFTLAAQVMQSILAKLKVDERLIKNQDALEQELIEVIEASNNIENEKIAAARHAE